MKTKPDSVRSVVAIELFNPFKFFHLNFVSNNDKIKTTILFAD